MEWVNESKCPVCGSDKLAYVGFGILPVIHFDSVLNGVPLGVITNYSKCDCGLVFQNPHMDTEGLHEFYAGGTYRQLVEMSAGDMQEDEDSNQIVWADLISSGKHLDIGCSRGLMLQLTQAKGCEVLGVEPNKKYVNFGIPTVPSIYDVEGQWDTITCKHVLEHVPELTKFVEKMVSLLKPGGLLYLEVPEANAPGGNHRLFHLYEFTPEVIEKLFAGLNIEYYQAKPHHFFKMRKEQDD